MDVKELESLDLFASSMVAKYNGKQLASIRLLESLANTRYPLFMYYHAIACVEENQNEATMLLLSSALNALRLSAEGGDIHSQFLFGDAYFNGYADELISLDESVFWLKRSAELGHPDAMYCYALTFNITILDENWFPNKKKCDYWMKRAADAGHPEAQYSEAVSFLEKEGASIHERELAYEYCLSSKEAGYKLSSKLFEDFFSDG